MGQGTGRDNPRYKSEESSVQKTGRKQNSKPQKHQRRVRKQIAIREARIW